MNPVFRIHTWVIPLSCSFPRYVSLSVPPLQSVFPLKDPQKKCSALWFPPLYSNEKTCLLWWLVVLLSSCPKAAHSRDLSEAAPKSNNNPKKNPKLLGGSTNMPLFGRAHECKEYEHWSKEKVWIVSVMKWNLPKNQGDPHRDASEMQT